MSNYNYICENCDYYSNKKTDYNKHIHTNKHIVNINGDFVNNKNDIIMDYPCEICNKLYKSRVGLWKHKKNCIDIDISTVTSNVTSIDNENTNYKIDLLIKENTDFKNIILDMVKNNNETQKQMIEVCKTNTNTVNTMNNSNNTMVNSNNKTFNLQVFLNEQCKDAMNLSDFMESIQLSLEDLENMEKLGYVECMFKNIFGDMEFISIFDRPFHCSDFKRGIIYIKENGVWEKEEMGYTRLINAIRIVEKKNFKLLKEWTEKHPSFSDYNSPDNDKYVKLFGETMNGDKHNLAKLIRKLSKECVIDKSNI